MSAHNVTAAEVRAPIEARLHQALPGFLDSDLEEPREWFPLASAAALSSAVTPSVGVIVEGLSQEVSYDSRKGYDAAWDVTIAGWVRGADYADTRDRCERYTAALRATLLSAPQGVSRRWRWVDERYDLVTDRESARTLAGGYVVISVDVPSSVVPRLIGTEGQVESRFITEEVSVRPSRGYVGDLVTP